MRVYLRTFGCRANHYDSETARAMIESSGHVCVARAEDADVAIFNSCAVTAEAEADLRKAVRRAAREQPALRSVIMGCASGLPDRAGPLSLRALPTVEQLIAGADMPALAEALALPSSASVARATLQSTTRALLRIQDGCDEHCTFCATTLARGENRSRAGDELIAEAVRLAESHPEIVLTGVHIGSYGRDIGASLGELLARLVREVPLVRFRLSSLEATEVDDRLFTLSARSAAVRVGRTAQTNGPALVHGGGLRSGGGAPRRRTVDFRSRRGPDRRLSRRDGIRSSEDARARRAPPLHVLARFPIFSPSGHRRRASSGARDAGNRRSPRARAASAGRQEGRGLLRLPRRGPRRCRRARWKK